jgi:hypothetical protein
MWVANPRHKSQIEELVLMASIEIKINGFKIENISQNYNELKEQYFNQPDTHSKVIESFELNLKDDTKGIHTLAKEAKKLLKSL